MQYWPQLITENNFLWKEKALEIINEKSLFKENSIIIALRSEHFHENSRNVSPQLYRNANIKDWFHLLEACNEINLKKIFIVIVISIMQMKSKINTETTHMY